MDNTTRVHFLQPILDAMQKAEEMGGPDGEEYLSLMTYVRQEATRRYNAASHDAQLLPRDLTDAQYRRKAEREYANDDIDIDDNAVVSRCGDEDANGAYVQAWVWVSHRREEE